VYISLSKLQKQIVEMPDTNNDFELVRSFVSGDENSFNKIALKYQEKIYWHARKMTGNHLDADEILQEVLLVLYNRLKSFRFKSSLYTWIYRITATRSINFTKRKKVRQFFSLEDKESLSLTGGSDIIKNIENREKLSKLESVLQKIPAKQREVFIMRNFEELSYEEIAEITGRSMGGLKSNYFHAVKKIYELMKDE
jgi:RNA polymerase sigma-70 factor (ECF subfamily)